MAIIQVRGTYHNMPVIFHQENGQTLKITPGNFCPACHETRYLDVDEGFRECRNCGRCYFLPSQRQIDAAQPRRGDVVQSRQAAVSLESNAATYSVLSSAGSQGVAKEAEQCVGPAPV